jgi:hypothetical protein
MSDEERVLELWGCGFIQFGQIGDFGDGQHGFKGTETSE